MGGKRIIFLYKVGKWDGPWKREIFVLDPHQLLRGAAGIPEESLTNTEYSSLKFLQSSSSSRIQSFCAGSQLDLLLLMQRQGMTLERQEWKEFVRYFFLGN